MDGQNINWLHDAPHQPCKQVKQVGYEGSLMQSSYFAWPEIINENMQLLFMLATDMIEITAFPLHSCPRFSPPELNLLNTYHNLPKWLKLSREIEIQSLPPFNKMLILIFRNKVDRIKHWFIIDQKFVNVMTIVPEDEMKKFNAWKQMMQSIPASSAQDRGITFFYVQCAALHHWSLRHWPWPMSKGSWSMQQLKGTMKMKIIACLAMRRRAADMPAFWAFTQAYCWI